MSPVRQEEDDDDDGICRSVDLEVSSTMTEASSSMMTDYD